MFDYLLQHPYEVFGKLLEHIYLALCSVSFAICVGIPLGLLSWYYKKLGKWILACVNVIQTVPSLAFFGLMIPLPLLGGIGTKPAVIVLFLYSLLPIMKNTYLGLKSVSYSLVEAARGIGMTPCQQLCLVIVPDAFRIIMGGIRLSSVQIIGTVTIAAIIGAGGLGDLIYRGTSVMDYGLIIAGTIPAIILALVTDKALEFVENKVRIGSLMRVLVLTCGRYFWIIALVTTVFIFIGSSFTVFHIFVPEQEEIVIGVKNTTESRIITDMIKKYLQKTCTTLVRTVQLSSTNLAFHALLHGDIDFYMEYSGTIYTSFFKMDEKKSPSEIEEIIVNRLQQQYNVHCHKSLGFNNTYALAVRKELAEKYQLKTIRDLSRCSHLLKIGTTNEFHDRRDGLLGLKENYGLTFQEERVLGQGLRYQALNEKRIDLIDAFTTDGILLANDYQLLEDSDSFFPPYFAMLLVNEKSLSKHPQLEKAFQVFENRIDETTMRSLNYAVDILKQPLEEVSLSFLSKLAPFMSEAS